MSTHAYKLDNVCKTFIQASESIDVLKNVDLTIDSGDSIAILGASGSGKSTLLHILGALDNVTSGKVFFGDVDLTIASPEQKAALRREHISFIFQFHHLLPEFTTIENVAMPVMLSGMDKKQAAGLAENALEQVGLKDRIHHNVTTLSGGESQRAAIARAVMTKPRVLLADEPTGNLDQNKGQEIGSLLLKLNQELDMTLVVVTHNLELASSMNLNYELKAGKLNAL